MRSLYLRVNKAFWLKVGKYSVPGHRNGALGRKVYFCWWEAGFVNKALKYTNFIQMLNTEAKQQSARRNKSQQDTKALYSRRKVPSFVSKTFSGPKLWQYDELT